MSRKKVEGDCKICGKYGQLTFEHVPPKKAFNNQKFSYEATLEQIEKLEEKEPSFYTGNTLPLDGFKKKQGGIGYNSLCGKCNSDTGRWYANDYISWTEQAMSILLKSNGQHSLYYPTYIYPLRVIKQIITMFFSICQELRTYEPELVKFVLDKNSRFLSPRYKIYCYYNLSGGVRYLGDNYIGNLNYSGVLNASEISFRPFGFVLAINSDSPDKRLTDITHFSRSHYNQWTDFYQRFNVLPVYLPYSPIDYRSGNEISDAIQRGLRSKNGLDSK